MKAILRAGAALLGLLLAGSASFGYVWVSPVFKRPYPQAPNFYNTGGVYYYDAWGRVMGPYYFIQPPCPPFGGILPGKTGDAIMSGNLPHTLLLSKEGLAIGNVPMIGQKHEKGSGQEGPHAGAGLPEMGGPPGAYLIAGGANSFGPASAPQPNMQIPYGQMPNMQIPYGQMPNMQIPYGQMPYSQMPNPNVQVPYPIQGPYSSIPNRGMPGPMPYPMQQPNGYGYGSMPMPMPMQQAPYGYGSTPMQQQPRMAMPVTYYPMSYDARSAIWQVQNVAPGGPQPFMPIPGFGVPAAPMPPTAPGMPMPGGGGMDGGNGFQYFGPMQQADRFSTFNPLQTMPSPMSPMSPMETMQPPRMDYAPPPAQKLGGNAYPSHPFVRSPRDFFMWGENMDDEIRLRRRPFPVP